MLGVTSSINCNDVANINSTDYGTCNLTFDNDGNATVVLNGAADGKFNNMACQGTKNNIECITGTIDIPTPAECFAIRGMGNIIDYDINENACKTFVINEWDYSEEDAELYCTGETDSYGYSLAMDIMDFPQDLIDNNVIINVEYEGDITITGYNETCPKDVII